jgi:hypothetical protein
MPGTVLMGTRLIVMLVCMRRRRAPTTIRAAHMTAMSCAFREPFWARATLAAGGVSIRRDGAFNRHIWLLALSLTLYLLGLADLCPNSPPNRCAPPTSRIIDDYNKAIGLRRIPDISIIFSCLLPLSI